MNRILTVLFLLLFNIGQAQTATEIVKKAEDKLRGSNSKGTMTMTIERPTWSRDVSMKTWSRGTKFSMIYITDPARDKGTVFLKKENEIYNYLPNIERTVKMPPSMMMQSWMGSDFTNDDLVQESSLVTDYTHALNGTETIDGYETWKITLTPKPDAAVVWGKLVAYISKDEYLQLRTEFYDEESDLVNIMEGKEIKTLGGRVLPSKLIMTPVNDENQRTILVYHDLEFEVEIPDGFFTTQNMKRIH